MQAFTSTLLSRFRLAILGLFLAGLSACGGDSTQQQETADSPKAYPYLYPISQNGKWGFIDSAGQVVIPPQYEGADHFYEGLALVKQGGAWGYIQLDGTFRINPRFLANPQRFSDGLARGRFRDHFGYIDTSGNTIISPIYALGMPFQDGLACVQDDNKLWGFINKKGAWVVKPTLKEFAIYADGLYPIYRNYSYGFADTTGAVKIPAVYDRAYPFRDSLAYVYSEESDGFTNIRRGKFIDTQGKQAIAGTFSRSIGFSEGLAATEKDGKWGFIDRQGNIVIPFQYNLAGDFSGPLAPIYVGNVKDAVPVVYMATDVVTTDSTASPKLGYINRQGKVVYAPTW